MGLSRLTAAVEAARRLVSVVRIRERVCGNVEMLRARNGVSEKIILVPSSRQSYLMRTASAIVTDADSRAPASRCRRLEGYIDSAVRSGTEARSTVAGEHKVAGMGSCNTDAQYIEHGIARVGENRV